MKHVYYRKIKGYKYELCNDFLHNVGIKGLDIETPYVLLNRNGLLWVKKRYAWDGPSGPTFDTLSFMRGSLVHDALYQLIRRKKLPKEYKEVADNLLKEMCLQDGMSKLRAWYIHRAVKRLGILSCIPGSEGEDKIYCAPDN